jgi:hypothetical protein
VFVVGFDGSLNGVVLLLLDELLLFKSPLQKKSSFMCVYFLSSGRRRVNAACWMVGGVLEYVLEVICFLLDIVPHF